MNINAIHRKLQVGTIPITIGRKIQSFRKKKTLFETSIDKSILYADEERGVRQEMDHG